MGGCPVPGCGSMAGWEYQGFNAPGVTPTSAGQKLVDKHPSFLVPQWDHPKIHLTQSLQGPHWGWASVAHSDNLVINMFFIVLPLFPVSCFHSLAMSLGIPSQMNYVSKSFFQALLLGKGWARDACVTCLFLALKCESTLKITTCKCNVLFCREQYAAVTVQRCEAQQAGRSR